MGPFPTNNFDLATQIWPAIVELHSNATQDSSLRQLLETQAWQVDKNIQSIVSETVVNTLGSIRRDIIECKTLVKKLDDDKVESGAVDSGLVNVIIHLTAQKKQIDGIKSNIASTASTVYALQVKTSLLM